MGPGRALDPADWYVVAPNVLGGCQGSTGPASLAPDGLAWGSRFPFLIESAQVAACLADLIPVRTQAVRRIDLRLVTCNAAD